MNGKVENVRSARMFGSDANESTVRVLEIYCMPQSRNTHPIKKQVAV